jgi:putative ABC transport system permease protein
LTYTNNGRNQLSFVLARTAPGYDVSEVTNRIQDQTGLLALSSSQFRTRAIDYVIANTGIPISFGTVIALGIIVGVCVVGLMFNLFVLENLKHFAVLKAIGTRNYRLIGMVALQAMVVGIVGYGIGIGTAAAFFEFAGRDSNFAGFFLPWQIAIGSGGVATAIITIASLVALRRVLFIEPAIVFRG